MKMKAPAMPKPQEPVRVPTPEDPDIIEARRARTLEEEAKRKGRASTSLSGEGGAFTRTTLG